MRRVLLAFLLLFASLTPASAQWREYVYAAQGFAIQFPAAPRITRGVYLSTRFGQLPATLYTAEHENILYKMTVADFPLADEGANLMGEAAYALMREGEVTFNDIPRVDNAPTGVFGIGMVLDLADGRRLRSSVYYNKRRFYRADAYVLPERGDKDMSIPSRFDQTLRFNVAPAR